MNKRTKNTAIRTFTFLLWLNPNSYDNLLPEFHCMESPHIHDLWEVYRTLQLCLLLGYHKLQWFLRTQILNSSIYSLTMQKNRAEGSHIPWLLIMGLLKMFFVRNFKPKPTHVCTFCSKNVIWKGLVSESILQKISWKMSCGRKHFTLIKIYLRFVGKRFSSKCMS